MSLDMIPALREHTRRIGFREIPKYTARHTYAHVDGHGHVEGWVRRLPDQLKQSGGLWEDLNEKLRKLVLVGKRGEAAQGEEIGG